MRGVYYSACSLCYKTITQFHQKCLQIRDCLLFRRLLLPESTVELELSIQTIIFKVRLRRTEIQHHNDRGLVVQLPSYQLGRVI